MGSLHGGVSFRQHEEPALRRQDTARTVDSQTLRGGKVLPGRNGNRPINTKTRDHHHLVVRVFKLLGSATGSIPRTTSWSKSPSKSTNWATEKVSHAWTASVYRKISGSPIRISKVSLRGGWSVIAHRNHDRRTASTMRR